METKRTKLAGRTGPFQFSSNAFLWSFVHFILFFLYHLPFGMAQCDPPLLAGVPEDMVVESKYLQTTEVTYYLADGGSIENSNELTTYDYVAMAPTTEVEQIARGYNDIDDNIFVREVMNAEEYFPSYTLPYSHTVQYGGISTFFQGDQPIHTTVVDSSFINGDVNESEDGDGDDLPTEGDSELDFIENGDEQLVATGENFEVILDTVAKSLTTIEYDSLGVWQYRVVEQFPLTETGFDLPSHVYSVERRETVNGLCAFKVVEEHITDLCPEQTVELRSSGTIEKDFEIQVYPNPVRNNLNIVPSHTPSKDALLQIYDVSGRQVESREGMMVKNLIEMGSYTPGLYFLRYSDHDQVITKKIIKQ